MKALVLPLSILMVAAALSGCLDGTNDSKDDAKELPIVSDLKAGPSLWNDPQNAPHPAFGFASLSAPPASENAPKWWKPIPEADLPKAITGISHLARSPEEVRSGAGIALFGSLAIVPGYGQNSAILDISD